MKKELFIRLLSERRFKELKEDLMTKLIEASKYDRHIVVEECVDCIELETAVLGNDDPIVSRVGQIMPHGEFYTFESKYEDEESKSSFSSICSDCYDAVSGNGSRWKYYVF